MRILFAASEALPYWTTGGLANVARALPDTLAERGHDVRVILPFYRTIKQQRLALEEEGKGVVPWPGGSRPVRYLLHRPAQGAPALLVDEPEHFDTKHPYGSAREDPLVTAERFAFFARTVVERARVWGADVVHLNDWQTGLVPVYAFLDGMPAASVFAIHNLAYQGNYAPQLLERIGIPRSFFRTENGLEFWATASFMKAGLALADRLVTVSPTYAREIQTPEGGVGFDGLLRFRRRLLHGILNGIDRELWNPATDLALPQRYDARTLDAKDGVRAALLTALGLEDRGPLLVAVTRLAQQKGIDLLLGAIPWILEHGGSLAVLGSGERVYEKALVAAAAANPGRIAVELGFNDPLARRLHAGGDFFLMPSRYEPCGLGQMIAQRYGTPPVVRRTGGLVDTVQDGLTGFSFPEDTPQGLSHALQRAFRAWRGRRWGTLRRRCMALDWSWNRSATQYEEVYRMAVGAAEPQGRSHD